MPAGAKPGERRGGRGKGTPNMSTVERKIIKDKIINERVPLPLAQRPAGRLDRTIEQRADVAARAIQASVQAGVPLAKDALNTFLGLFMNRAGHFAPKPDPATREERNPHASEQLFEKWARLSVETAKALAPFQSPTFRAIMVTPPPPDDTRAKKRFTLKVFDNLNGREIEADAEVDDEDDV